MQEMSGGQNVFCVRSNETYLHARICILSAAYVVSPDQSTSYADNLACPQTRFVQTGPLIW